MRQMDTLYCLQSLFHECPALAEEEGSGERKDHSLQNFRGPEETNLLQDVGSLEFPLEERNNGGKGKRRWECAVTSLGESS
ncbi:uncharacterized protein AAG666_001621 isoform 3-T11 [Megaptera novaeangliae]